MQWLLGTWCDELQTKMGGYRHKGSGPQACTGAEARKDPAVEERLLLDSSRGGDGSRAREGKGRE